MPDHSITPFGRHLLHEADIRVDIPGRRGAVSDKG